MRLSLKLNAIEQEHLQELYDAAGVARDELPYTPEYDKFVQDFQDRTFKNAEPEQVYGALLKYVRSSTCSATENLPAILEPELNKLLKEVLKRHGKSGKLLPYSSEFEQAHKEFTNLSKKELTPTEFWQAIVRSQSRSRKPPKRATAKAVKERDDEAEEDGE
jgi:hypothetical protein